MGLVLAVGLFPSSLGVGMAQTGSNSPPSVTITSPASGSYFTIGATIRLKANAQDPDGSVDSVQFVDGTNVLGTVTQPPYQLTLTNVSAGPIPWEGHVYSVTAIAMDNLGASATSAPVRILVGQDFFIPNVSLVQPAENAAFLAPAILPLVAEVRTSDGSENPVRFFSGTNLIGVAAAPPYTLTVSNLAVGQHVLLARYTDSLGNPGQSSDVHILVTPLALAALARLPDGRFSFSITGLSTGRNFEVQASSDHQIWTSLATNVATAAALEFIDPNATNANRRFYRAFQVLPE